MTNKLADSTSPYLLQHAHNPVDWYPWGQAALERAREEDKPIFLSIGYAACHWCHVMAHESFEDPDIAALMNQNYINIKVDREERPDLEFNLDLAAIAAALTDKTKPRKMAMKRSRWRPTKLNAISCDQLVQLLG